MLGQRSALTLGCLQRLRLPEEVGAPERAHPGGVPPGFHWLRLAWAYLRGAGVQLDCGLWASRLPRCSPRSSPLFPGEPRAASANGLGELRRVRLPPDSPVLGAGLAAPGGAAGTWAEPASCRTPPARSGPRRCLPLLGVTARGGAFSALCTARGGSGGPQPPAAEGSHSHGFGVQQSHWLLLLRAGEGRTGSGIEVHMQFCCLCYFS